MSAPAEIPDSTATPADPPPDADLTPDVDPTQDARADETTRAAVWDAATGAGPAPARRAGRGGPMSAVILMRLGALQRTGKALAPAIGALVVLSVLYGGGQARPAEAYGVSAVLLFAVFAWQTKILLDVEPDVQRRLTVVALRSRRKEVLAGLYAAALSTIPLILAALALPWIFGALVLPKDGPGLVPSLLLGVWAHVLVVPPAVALGAWCSRVIAGNPGRAVTALAAGVVAALLLGVKSSPVPWVAPPLLASARVLSGARVDGVVTDRIDYAALLPLTAWALAWSAVLFAGYGWLRRSRA
jgi:hypothetical protein